MNFLSFLPKEYRYAYNQSDEEIEKSKISEYFIKILIIYI